MDEAALYRELPSVDELLRDPDITGFIAQAGRVAVADACRAVLARLREEITAGYLDSDRLALALEGIPAAIRDAIAGFSRYSLKPVINATGVVLHTNLGRAPLAATALEHIQETAAFYSNLEFDLTSGERGRRDAHVDRLFSKLFAEISEDSAANVPSEGISATQALNRPDRVPGVSTIVVNNNAAAVLLALNTLADGGEVIVSRGELVEIGGSFRIPDVMAKSGAALVEVGTTNRTRIHDYERAINERTRLLLRVHRSNFEITGFTEQPPVRELAALARKHKLPLMEDLGSGGVFDLRQLGISGEGTVLDRLRAGVHVVTYSGDKLLGGPQAGIISGREDLVKRMRSNSLFRALRVDKLTYAALEATLLAYVRQEHATIPAVRMALMTKADIERRAQEIRSEVDSEPLRVELIDGESLIGGGAAPSAVLPTKLLAVTCQSLTAEQLVTELRRSDPPVIARVEEGRVLLDLRTVFPEQDQVVRQTLTRIAKAENPK